MFVNILPFALLLSIFECSINGMPTAPHTTRKLGSKIHFKEEDNDIRFRDQREKIKSMMKLAWKGYKTYAWGKNELSPIAAEPFNSGIFGNHDLGLTIVDSMDTLYIMDLQSEYREARQWVKTKLSIDIDDDFSVFETNIRFIGGLLTMFAFTGDKLYKVRAQKFADKLMPAFKTPTGLPYALVNFKTGVAKNYDWAHGSILSEVGTLHLEFTYLSDITGVNKYHAAVDKIRKVLNKAHKPNGLYPNFIDPSTGNWGREEVSLGALGDSFYEYLLKSWIQSDKQDGEARHMYDEAMQAVVTNLVKKSSSGLKYLANWKNGRLEHKMDHLACFAGGMLALGATTKRHMEIAKDIAITCHESYINTNTMLGPDVFRFDDGFNAVSSKVNERVNLLRPETVETYFLLWRLTKDQKYRDWGWEIVEALESYSESPNGFVGLKNVYNTTSEKDDVQQSYFLAETLKYLYLLFCDDNVLPLDQWVFNTEAHPMPIKNKNPFYRSHLRNVELSDNY